MNNQPKRIKILKRSYKNTKKMLNQGKENHPHLFVRVFRKGERERSEDYSEFAYNLLRKSDFKFMSDLYFLIFD